MTLVTGPAAPPAPHAPSPVLGLFLFLVCLSAPSSLVHFTMNYTYWSLGAPRT